MKVEFRVINKIEKEDGMVLVKTNTCKELWVHSDLVNDEEWETIKRKPPSKERKQARMQSKSQQTVKKSLQQKETETPVRTKINSGFYTARAFKAD